MDLNVLPFSLNQALLLQVTTPQILYPQESLYRSPETMTGTVEFPGVSRALQAKIEQVSHVLLKNAPLSWLIIWLNGNSTYFLLMHLISKTEIPPVISEKDLESLRLPQVILPLPPG